MNLLHDIEPGTKESVNAIIEVPKDSHNKYEPIKNNGVKRARKRVGLWITRG
jgi:inorganic pyrophosphatase